MKRLALVLVLVAATACESGQQAAESAQGVAGQHWKGTVLQVYQFLCTSRATAPVEFTTADDGRFQTAIPLTEVGSDCPIPTANLWNSQAVQGRLTQTRLEINGAPTITGTVDREGNHITGTYKNSAPANPNQTYTTTWQVECEKGCR